MLSYHPVATTKKTNIKKNPYGNKCIQSKSKEDMNSPIQKQIMLANNVNSHFCVFILAIILCNVCD